MPDLSRECGLGQTHSKTTATTHHQRYTDTKTSVYPAGTKHPRTRSRCRVTRWIPHRLPPIIGDRKAKQHVHVKHRKGRRPFRPERHRENTATAVHLPRVRAHASSQANALSRPSRQPNFGPDKHFFHSPVVAQTINLIHTKRTVLRG